MKTNLQHFIDVQTKRAFSVAIVDEFNKRGVTLPSYSKIHSDESIPVMMFCLLWVWIHSKPNCTFSIIGMFVNNLNKAIPEKGAAFDENINDFVVDKDLVLSSDNFYQLVTLYL